MNCKALLNIAIEIVLYKYCIIIIIIINMICYGLGQDPLNFLVPLPSKSISGYCQDVRKTWKNIGA